MRPPCSFAEFWPHYVRAHRDPITRGFHLCGTLVAWGLLGAAIVLRNVWFLPAALVVPYTFAWSTHFLVEHNFPPTFKHPYWSWLADQKMVAMMLAGKMGQEIRRLDGKGLT